MLDLLLQVLVGMLADVLMSVAVGLVHGFAIRFDCEFALGVVSWFAHGCAEECCCWIRSWIFNWI